MKESNWQDCIESGSSLKVSPDNAKSNSLKETAQGRVEYLKENAVKEYNANYIFEGYYTSILELFHALILSKGYRVNNHVCIGFYLRDILQRNDLFRIFDDLRYKRNSLTYYGKRMDFETAKKAVTDARNLIEKISSLIDNWYSL